MSEPQTPERNGVEPEQQSQRRNHAEPEPQSSEPNRTVSEPDVLEKAQARIAQLEDGWRRAAAELDNFRKRCAKDLVRARYLVGVCSSGGWLRVF
jgi:molecular chaperone GrpE